MNDLRKSTKLKYMKRVNKGVAELIPEIIFIFFNYMNIFVSVIKHLCIKNPGSPFGAILIHNLIIYERGFGRKDSRLRKVCLHLMYKLDP